MVKPPRYKAAGDAAEASAQAEPVRVRPSGLSLKGRALRYLAARGFGGDVIRRVVSGADADDQ